MPSYEISDLDDPRLAPFREIRNRNWTEHSGLFIAEGPLLVQRLLESDYATRSVLLDNKFASQFAGMIPEQVDQLIVEHGIVEQLLGFNFHRGVLGCGLRKPPLQLRRDFGGSIGLGETMLAAVGVQDPENLGGILRTCAALGIERVIVGPGTADPLSRRVLRVSMGSALRLQLLRSRDIVADIHWLQREFGVTSVATTLHREAEPLESVCRNSPMLIMVGNERNGLPESVQASAALRVRIDMQLGTDSLNVCVAAGIIMHYFCRLAASD